MKNFILIIALFLSFNITAQDTVNKKTQDTTKIEKPKLVWNSYSDVKQTYSISFLSDGSIQYQSQKYDYINDKKVCNTFTSIEDIKQLQKDMMQVLKAKKTISNEKYTIEKGAFSSVELKIKGIDRTYYFTKYALKLFGKELKRY